MSQEKTDKLIKEGRIDPDTGARKPDPAVHEADRQAALDDGRIVVDEDGNDVPTDVPPGTPSVDGNATP